MSYWQQSNWATSAKGKNIALFASKPIVELVAERPLLFIGGVHGDEPEGVELAEKWLMWLIEHNQQYNAPWVLITCINPDGYNINERTNGNGVDLNRNFPSMCWSDECKAPRYFPGSSPGSEPEVKALAKLIEQIPPTLIIHFHSWEPSIVYSGDSAKHAAEILAQASGYKAQPDIGYPTPGSLGEYGANDLGIGVICIEEQEGEPLENVFPRFKAGLIELMSLKLKAKS
ncbi:MAG: DUF2817 domain-containing protein [Thalassotalea sp.]|nr:DUF2817 domain-containing protein [Thalassotalea sp.]